VEGKPSTEEKRTALPAQHPRAPQPGGILTSGSSGNAPDTQAASLLLVAPLGDFPPLNSTTIPVVPGDVIDIGAIPSEEEGGNWLTTLPRGCKARQAAAR